MVVGRLTSILLCSCYRKLSSSVFISRRNMDRHKCTHESLSNLSCVTQVVIRGGVAQGHEQWPRGGQADQQRGQAEGHGARAQGLVQVEAREEFEFSASCQLEV